MFIGQETDGKPNPRRRSNEEYDPQFDMKQAFSGQVTQVEIWDTDLSASDIEKIATCSVSTIRPEKRIVTWKSEAWVPNDVDFTDVPLKALCERNTISHQFIWPRDVNFEVFSRYCDTFDGIPPLVKPYYGGKGKPWKYIYDKTYKIFDAFEKELPSTFKDLTKKSGRQCFNKGGDLRFWTGIQRNTETDQWYSNYDFYNFTLLNLLLPSQAHKCVSIDGGTYRTSKCISGGPCGICRMSQDKIIYLKGLCKNDFEHFDIKFYIHGAKNNRPYFK